MSAAAMAGAAPRWAEPRKAAGLILVVAIGTIAGALVFEHAWGLRPCKLCLVQRDPYYVAMPVALLAAVWPGAAGLRRLALAVLGLVFLVSAGLGAYHAGVEWGFWPGPNDCGGATAPAPGTVGDFLSTLQTARVVSCTEAAWRFLGLSLAGWNVVISLGLAALAALALRRSPALGAPHGN